MLDQLARGSYRVARLYHTARHLKPIQIYARLQNRYRRCRPKLEKAPPRRSQTTSFSAPISRPQSLIGPTRIRFLNEEGNINRPDQWNDPEREKLWLYNLHYFDTLAGPIDKTHKDWQRILLSRWIIENPPGAGNGWEPYPVSLRIVNWIKWALRGAEMEEAWLNSLAVQARWLENCLEWHLLGNHLLANAKALVFAGLFFDGPEAELWLKRGLSIYERELPEQILSDGGHFERSPMYHSIILEDLLDLYNLACANRIEDRYEFRRLPHLTKSMRNWLAVMTHPDDGPSFFNDTAFGIAGSRKDLEAYAKRLRLSKISGPSEDTYHLAASGYVRVNNGDMTAILDLAAIGPDYLPGHAHADTLSFEMSVGEERVIVNSGTSLYGRSQLRQYQRSTAAHSTVEIDGEDSSEVWGGFRVARRAHVHNVKIDDIDHAIRVKAEHDGYKRLGGNIVHSRCWWIEPGRMTVEDLVSGRFSRAVVRFHLGPKVDVSVHDNGTEGEILLAQGRRIRWITSLPARIEPSNWYPEFGKIVNTKMLVIDAIGNRLETSFII